MNLDQVSVALPKGGRGLLPRGGFAILSLLIAVTTASAADMKGSNDWSELSLEQLVNIELRSPAGLTEIDPRRMPVAMTQLDAQDVQQSGARNLNQLLEIYVPNAQFLLHHAHNSHLGIRGIISDRDDKYLYQVNGVTMNNRLLLGADNERGIPLLGDIRSVSVVRGPASATHGAGALAGVVDVETYNGLTFQGADLTIRQGVIDQYSAVEARYGHRFSETSGLFIYSGVADVQGASDTYYLGHSFPAKNGLPDYNVGHPVRGPIPNLNEPAFGSLWHKVHASYVNGPWEVWGRFVQDGTMTPPSRTIYMGNIPVGTSLEEWTRGRQIRNQQYTGAVSFKKELSPTWKLELLQSSDFWQFKDERAGTSPRPTRTANELQVFSRAIGFWTPNDVHSLAFGVEYSHFWFHDPPQSDALDVVPVVSNRNWQTDTISFLAEHQWRITDQWTTFLSFRTDKHTYSDWLFSPRGTVVFMPTERDTFKLMAGQSVRRSGDEELWSEWKRNRTIPDPETLSSFEIAYERKLTDRWRAGVNAFYEDYDAIGYSSAVAHSISIGRFKIAGGEFELTYTNANTRFTFSEGVAKLVSASLPTSLPVGGQGITAEPYGFGNDLAQWSPFITKLALAHDVGKQWTISSSVIYYFGFPGAEDYAKFNNTQPTPIAAAPYSDPGYDEPYGPNVYVNLGVEYRPSSQWTLRVDGYNLAGLVDEKLSKRNYYFRTSEFSVQPPSMAVSVRYRF
jgi:iron complex outermembrane receptor protein